MAGWNRRCTGFIHSRCIYHSRFKNQNSLLPLSLSLSLCISLSTSPTTNTRLRNPDALPPPIFPPSSICISICLSSWTSSSFSSNSTSQRQAQNRFKTHAVLSRPLSFGSGNVRKKIWDNSCSGSLDVFTQKEVEAAQVSGQMEQWPQASETLEPEMARKLGKGNLRKSFEWDSAFFTSAGFLEPDELSSMIKGADKRGEHLLTGIEVDMKKSIDSISLHQKVRV